MDRTRVCRTHPVWGLLLPPLPERQPATPLPRPFSLFCVSLSFEEVHLLVGHFGVGSQWS